MATINRKHQRGYRPTDDRYVNTRNRNTGFSQTSREKNFGSRDLQDFEDYGSSTYGRNQRNGYPESTHFRRGNRYSFDAYQDQQEQNNRLDDRDFSRQEDGGTSHWGYNNLGRNVNSQGYYGQGENEYEYGSLSQQDRDRGFSYNSRRNAERTWDKVEDESPVWSENSNQRYGQHKGKGPKGYTRSDERIKEDINDQLSDHGDIDASEIEVNVQQGEVTLTGRVFERYAKRIAEDVVEGVSGVKNVENRLRIGTRHAFTGSDSSSEATKNTGEGTFGSGKSTSSPMGNNYGTEKNKTK